WFEELLPALSLILWHALLAASLHLTRCRKTFFTADELIQLTKRPSPKQFSSDFALQRELRGRLRETHGSSSVSTGSGPRDVLSTLRIARTTSPIQIPFMHLRSKSHEFQRQHGAHGSPLYRLMFPVYPDSQCASPPP